MENIIGMDGWMDERIASEPVKLTNQPTIQAGTQAGTLTGTSFHCFPEEQDFRLQYKYKYFGCGTQDKLINLHLKTQKVAKIFPLKIGATAPASPKMTYLQTDPHTHARTSRQAMNSVR